jgi:cytochrome c oxidase subunit 1
MFVAGMSDYAELVFSGLTFLVAIPSGVKVFNWVATLYKGSVSFESPMLYALAFLVLFTIGGLTGLFLGTLAVDIHLHDTYFVVAHFHYVMVGGTVFGFLGGLHYWWPKMFGRMYNENLARVAFTFVFIGFNMTFFTQFILGSRGMPRRYYDYLPHFQPLHAFSSVGAYVLGIGFLIMLYMFIDAIRNGPKAPPNPWGSAGYEWMTTSPPHPHNFSETPVMTRGPYDYHLATEEELSTGFHGEVAHHASDDVAPPSSAPAAARDSDDSDDEKSKDDDE